ncbi:MAG TPA: hypothetical protein VFZ48_03270 [Candidatus Saccharimonadales bacterium]
MVEITTTLCKRAKDLTFDIVVGAMDHSNVCSYIEEEVDKFVRDNSLADVAHIFMATHSIGEREWEIEEGREPAFFNEEGLNGGWFIFCEEDVNYLFCASATSGSSLMAEKQADGTWSLRLEVPIRGDGPYKGAYWQAFHQALGIAEEASAVA